MSTFFCQQCSKETEFLPVFKAVKAAGVSRSTIYYWIDHNWIHWRELRDAWLQITGDLCGVAQPSRTPGFSAS